MPVLEMLWVLLGLFVFLPQSIQLYTRAKHRSSLLTDILMKDSLDTRQKRQNWHQNNHVTWSTQDSKECCPSITHGIAPLGGLSREGTLLQLFRDSNTVQIFYETRCADRVHNNPCRFLNESEWVSRCEQKFIYTYAIVKDFNATEPFRMDYIKIKSGCSCTILGPFRPPRDKLARELLQDEMAMDLLEGQ